ncbi:MAG: AAA family ATPase [Candidatus Nomurabacteria bacterium]|nr:AAA family ATPase [Candidatus Nomurabacteria bacterium]
MKILITGISGAGKTTTLAELQKHGCLVIDLDATGLCRWKNIQTGEVAEYGLDGKDYKWLTEHGWYCDIEKFKLLLSCIREDKLVFVSGVTENFKEFLELFDKVFLLDTDNDILEKRLLERTNNHFARKEDERSFVFKHTRELLNQIKNPIHINTNSSPDIVAQTILDNLEIH